MARAYCSPEDVKKYLPPNVIIEGENPSPNYRSPNPETVTNIDIDFFINQACRDIDGSLITMYDVPLKKTNFDGDIVYPNPIPVIAAIWAAQQIYAQKLQGADKQYSEAQKVREEWAMNEILRIQNGEIRLFGQRNNRGDRFVRSSLRGAPKNPAEGGRSKGGKG